MTVEDIIRKISGKGIDLVCISGGEPLFQVGLLDLIKGLVDIGMRMDVETNGSFDIKELVELGSDVMVSMDSKTPSSGETDSLIISNLSYLRSFDQLKFVVSDERDISYAVDLIKEHSPRCNIIFTPVDNQNGGDMASFLMDLVMSGDLPSTVRLMVQTHKVLWNAEKRGV
jgi:7-carboxy-7-deazaguanine synthase